MNDEVNPSGESGSNELGFLPMGKRVVVARKVPDVGALEMPDELKREAHPDIGTIRMVGQIGWWNKWVRGIRPGRQIHFVRFSPVKIETPDGEYIYVDVENILGISKA